MALDTRSKRASAVNFLGAFVLALPLPDGAINQGDRQHNTRSYSGILAAAPTAPVSTFGYVLVKDPTLARGAEWRHALPSLVTFLTGPMTFTPPIAVTELGGANPYYRAACVLTGANAARVALNVKTPFAGSTAAVQYSVDGGSSWDYLDGATGPLADASAAGTTVGDWVSLDALAQDDVILRVVTELGDGATPAVWYNVYVEFSFAEV